ncbi:MAG: 23S rRNA (uracil(1939)-C(5))-methyltransferase RlmD [Candidatus Altimarinota bacterium]
MPKNDIIDNVLIEKLIFGGKGLATAQDGRKIIVSGGVIPGSIVNLRVLKNKKSHIEAQQIDVVKKSPIEKELEPGHQLYGGAKWLTIKYEDQLRIKAGQIEEAFYHISKYLETNQIKPVFHPIVPSPEIYGYRNKVEFSWGKYISAREGIHDDFRFGFHAQGQFDRIDNCEYCALADEQTNALFKDVDKLSRASNFPTYDPKTAQGFWRHLVVRKGRKTDEIMIIFSIHSLWNPPENSQKIQDLFTLMVQELTEKYKNIRSIYFLENTGRADIVTGNPICIYGDPIIEDELFGMHFEIQPKSFFQVNTFGAEKLYQVAIDFIHNKEGVLLDLYAGTGTIGLLLSEHFKEVYSVELVESASNDGMKNALNNGIKNVRFMNEKVEDFAKKFLETGGKADTIILDPPRDGMHPSTYATLLSFSVNEIIYVSCNPATLARDLEVFIGKNRDEKTEGLPRYRITDITPVDMFPHTHHIETVVRMERI